MTRIKFKKGEERAFIKLILEKTNCPSLRSLNQFGFQIPYSTLKNYITEKRTIPKEFFQDLCELAKINPKEIEHEEVEENWGQIIGGKRKKLSLP